MAGLSIRGYARHRRVSHTAVQKALATGRIVAGANGRIDPAVADVQWATSTNLSKPRNSVTGVPRKRKLPGAPSDPLGVEGGAGGEPNGHNGGEAARLVSSYAASRVAREAYMARLAKLDFEQRSGKLVDADQVRAQIFALGRRVRDQIMGLPDRLAPVLVGQPQAEVHRILSQELAASLTELSGARPVGLPGHVETEQ